MTPVFSLPLSPIQFALQNASLPVQSVSFDALLTVSSGPDANASDIPAASLEPIGSLPVAEDNAVAIMAVPEADIDAAIRPLLAAYAGDPTRVSISVVSPPSVSGELSVPDGESDEAQPDQPECMEMVVPNSIVIPMPIQLPALVANIVAPTVSPTATAIAKADQPPKVAIPKGGPRVMESDVEAVAQPQAASVQTKSVRQNVAPALQQLTQDASLPVNKASAIPTAELAALFAATPVESNTVPGAGFQTIMAERIAETAIRPLTDASAVVADRALDVARGSLWLDQLAGDIVAVQDKDRDLSFRLIPAQLGQLDVNIGTRDDGLQLNFCTQSEEAARIIGGAQSRLIEELKAQGVRVAGSEVNAGSGKSTGEQQNSHSALAETITEFERSSPQFTEPNHASERQNGRFA